MLVRTVRWILKVISKRNTKGFKQIKIKIELYNALSRSNLEFSSVVGHPHYAVHSQRIESLNTFRASTKHLAFTTNTISPRSFYDLCLKCYKMNSQRERRRRSNFFPKLANNRLDCNELVSLFSIAETSKIPRHPIIKQDHVQPVKPFLGVKSPLNRVCTKISIFITEVPDFVVHHDSISHIKIMSNI